MSTKFTSTSKQSLHNNIDNNINNKKDFVKNDLKVQENDRVPIQHFGATLTDFKKNLPDNFASAMRNLWGADRIGGNTALENFYNFHAMKGTRHAPFYWIKVFKMYMLKEKE
jgi:hypothetical protein